MERDILWEEIYTPQMESEKDDVGPCDTRTYCVAVYV